MRFCVLICIAIFVSCSKEDTQREIVEIPAGFPSIEFPEGNEYTYERWNLGKQLFYDKSLSRSQTVSCASCHHPHLAFSDSIALSLGDENRIGTTNTPTLANVAYHPYFTRAGGVPTLEMQILVPIQEHNEFNFNIVDLVERLKQIPSYVKQAQTAYQRDLDPFVITRAIANFERSIISGNSAYDKFIHGAGPLSESALRGKRLFMSDRTNCSKCHSDFNFTNNSFQNNGLHEAYVDSGRMRLTRLESDRALFKVPTLRNIELTGPYMHDGSLSTLSDVIEHYNKGGKNHKNKSDFIKPLNLSNSEKSDLISFLKSLTDLEFITNQKFKQ